MQAQSIKGLTPGFSSNYDLTVMGSSPESSSVLVGESAWGCSDHLRLPFPPLMHARMHTLSQINKSLKTCMQSMHYIVKLLRKPVWWFLNYKGFVFTTNPEWSYLPPGYRFLTSPVSSNTSALLVKSDFVLSLFYVNIFLPLMALNNCAMKMWSLACIFFQSHVK